MLTKIWQRYIFKDLLKCFVFFLFSFSFLYFLTDFMLNISYFCIKNHFSLSKVLCYYAHQLFNRLPILLPLAVLISTIKVLSSLSLNKELTALQASGLSLKKLLFPFWLLAGFCSLIGYMNEEILIPKLSSYLDETKVARSKKMLQKLTFSPFTILYLKDSSKLVYQTFDREKQAFFDVYWIRSFNDIWQMEYLTADPQKPLGESVTHIIRNDDGLLEKKESYAHYLLPSLNWEANEIHRKQPSVKYQKISHLAIAFLKKEGDSFFIKGQIATYFFYKLLLPLMPFLVLMGVIPYCVNYSRDPSIVLLYAISIFSLVVFFILLNSLVIMGESQAIPPFVAIGLPFILCFGGFYLKSQKRIFSLN